MCPIDKCGLDAHTPHGFCWVHYVRFVVVPYSSGKIDSLPVKRAIRCRLMNYGCGRDELAEILGVSRDQLNGMLNPRRVWMQEETFDKWATLLHLDISPLHQAVA